MRREYPDIHLEISFTLSPKGVDRKSVFGESSLKLFIPSTPTYRTLVLLNERFELSSESVISWAFIIVQKKTKELVNIIFNMNSNVRKPIIKIISGASKTYKIEKGPGQAPLR